MIIILKVEIMNIKTKKRNRIKSDQYNNKNENNESINNNYEYEIKTLLIIKKMNLIKRKKIILAKEM